MHKNLLVIILIPLIGTLPVFPQWNQPFDSKPAPLQVAFGSVYSLSGLNNQFRIESNEVLPISIAIKNSGKPVKFSISVVEPNSVSRYAPIPIPKGIKFLDKNPTKIFKLNPFECKLFNLRIQINTNKHQFFCLNVLSNDGKLLESVAKRIMR